MSIRNIILYGHPTLRQKSEKVTEFNRDLQVLIDDMTETMYAEPGVGLAANQVDIPLQVAVVDLSVGEDPEGLIVLINPEIIEAEGSQREEEGCLSIPDIRVPVKRPYRLTVRALDRNGTPFTLTGEGLLARACCHEIDHLRGVLIVDYLKGLQRRMIQKKLNAIAEFAS